jgi:hypothetical protein
MFRYSGYSLVISSELALPELPEAEGEPDVFIRLGKIPRVVREACVNDELAYHNLTGAYHIMNGREIVVDPLPDVNPDALRVVLLGRVMAYLLRQRGWLSLHASGVAVGSFGVLFLGASGSGKSTTAAAFYRRGHQVITDDVAAVRVSGGKCIALPARPRLRLHSDSRSVMEDEASSGVLHFDKYLFGVASGPSPETIRIQRIYVLADGDEVGAQTIPAAPSVRLLSAHSFFRRRTMDLASLHAHLHDCAAVTGAVSVRRLVRPRLLNQLPAVIEFVEKDLTSHE